MKTDLNLSRSPKAAPDATSALFPFAPAAPKSGYTGPAFSLGYEVRASAPFDLTADQFGLENNTANSQTTVLDTISLSAQADWSDSQTYSVAVAVVFPTPKFNLDSLAYSSTNWVARESDYNQKLRHRWIVQTGGKYYINTGFLGRSGRATPEAAYTVHSSFRSSNLTDKWVVYDPAKSLFADLNGPSVKLGDALYEVTGVGFYMDSVDFKGTGKVDRQWQFKLLTLTASGFSN